MRHSRLPNFNDKLFLHLLYLLPRLVLKHSLWYFCIAMEIHVVYSEPLSVTFAGRVGYTVVYYGR